jgi:ADP-heptose:LPS heptosyltransferase
VAVTWGPGERELAEGVCAGAASPGVVLGPATESLGDLIELIRRAALFVSSDTGPMHLAAASGVRCVALFGPKDPRVYGPFGDGHVVVQRAAADGVAAMQRIEVADVLAGVDACLASTEEGPAGARAAAGLNSGGAAADAQEMTENTAPRTAR